MSTVPNTRSRPPINWRFENVSINILKALFAIGCLFYSVLAFDYFISFALGQNGLWMKLFAAVVSPEYAYGIGSVHMDQHQTYSEALRFLLMHTTMVALCMAIGPFQFVASFRKKYRGLHRTMGKVYLVAVCLSMFAGLGYLAITPFANVFSGAPFAIGLVALHVIVLFSAYKAYSAIRRGNIRKHQSWMAMNYALLLPTPILRLLWIIFGLGFPTLNQAQANLAITTFLIPLSVLFGLVWVAAQKPTRTLRRNAA